jgi:hypothetical protein
MAQLIIIAHNALQKNQIDQIISIYGERLNNELTREATLKALTLMAKNQPGVIKLQGLSSLTPKLVDLMHKAQRQIHLSTLEAVLAMVSRYPAQFSQQAGMLQGEIVKFINENDIQRSALAIQCAQNIININKGITENSHVL